MSGVYGGETGVAYAPQLLIQEFTTVGLSGLFQPPTNLIVPSLMVSIEGTGAGAGGGSGKRGPTGVLNGGGSGGEAGRRTVQVWNWQELADMIGVSIFNLYYRWEIGGKGMGGPIPGINSNGIVGTSGGTTRLRIQNLSGSLFKTILQSGGGSPGGGGVAGSVGGGSGTTAPGTYSGSPGGTGPSGIGSNAPSSNNAPSGGGGGAGQGLILAANAGGFAGNAAVGEFGLLVSGVGSGLDALTTLPPRIPGSGGGGGPTNIDGSGGRPGNGYRGGGGGGGPGTINGMSTFPGANGGDGYGTMNWRT